MDITPLLATALLLNITTLLEIFAQCNRIADARDQEMIQQRVQNRQRKKLQPLNEEQEDEDEEEEKEEMRSTDKTAGKNSTINSNSNHHNLTSEAGVVNQILLMKNNKYKSGGNVV